jgi:hypothetical protein
MRVPDFYSINEVRKPGPKRGYHNNDACILGRDIPQNDKRNGTGGYRLCDDCEKLSKPKL